MNLLNEILGLSVLLLNMGQQPEACTVEEFKTLMYKVSNLTL